MPASLSDLPLVFVIAIPAIVLLAYTIFGATGFGSAIVPFRCLRTPCR